MADREETIYDRLGDLLNETLEAGKVKFVRLEKNDESKGPAEETEKAETKSETESINDAEKNSTSYQNEKTSPYRKKRTVIKKITPEIERAFRLLEITVSASEEDLKKAYKEKLKYYHPDKYQGNEVMQKVATDKTRQVVEAYNLLLEFLK